MSIETHMDFSFLGKKRPNLHARPKPMVIDEIALAHNKAAVDVGVAVMEIAELREELDKREMLIKERLLVMRTARLDAAKLPPKPAAEPLADAALETPSESESE